ncbi:NfeD family protein [Ureibacillus thermosphaericus]|uniref:NfeD family protein n=1 Tax=Ureibacillus thermosphaericus TaxID=51173 RepID=UPI000BBBF1C5|nr:nodulation protein NfeD [Ureibacillus thermosphaericus]
MNKPHIFRWIVLLAATLFFLFPNNTFAKEKVYHIPIENEVERGLYEFLKRSFKEAIENKADAIVLEIHTPGGYVDVAYDIGKLMDETPAKIIAFINSKALSAGAYIALHADEIYMTPNATMGAAQIIDMNGNAASEKANSAWIKNMQAAAESTNRNPDYARAMADASLDLPELNSPKGKLLTLTAEEAYRIEYSNGTVENLNELLAKTGFENSEVFSIHETFAEKLARFLTNPIVVTLLLTIASLGLVLELFSPGFGAPGIIGIISLILFFFGHTVAGFAGFETIILFIIGFVLLIAELFVPGGILGLVGGAIMIISLLFAGESIVHMAYSIIIALAIAIIGMVVLVKFFGKNLHVFSKLVLKEATSTEEGYVSNVNRIDLIGKEGITITPLRPSGTVLVDDERIDVVSEGSYIDSNKKVKVIEVEGSRIVVREIKEKEGD